MRVPDPNVGNHHAFQTGRGNFRIEHSSALRSPENFLLSSELPHDFVTDHFIFIIILIVIHKQAAGHEVGLLGLIDGLVGVDAANREAPDFEVGRRNYIV